MIQRSKYFGVTEFGEVETSRPELGLEVIGQLALQRRLGKAIHSCQAGNRAHRFRPTVARRTGVIQLKRRAK